jgi:hypothetical protein
MRPFPHPDGSPASPTSQRSLPAGLLGLCVALLLAACGQGGGGKAAAPGATATPPTPPTPPIDACALLTPEDVRSLTSEASGSLSSTLDDERGRDPSQCVYTVGSDLPPKVISLQVRQADGAGRAAALHRAAESGLDSLAGGTQPVPGLGDGAFWVGGKLDQLHVLAGSRQLIFSVQIDKDPLPAARGLAAKALARLQGGAKIPAR